MAMVLLYTSGHYSWQTEEAAQKDGVMMLWGFGRDKKTVCPYVVLPNGDAAKRYEDAILLRHMALNRTLTLVEMNEVVDALRLADALGKA